MQHTIYYCAHTFSGKLNRSEIAKLLQGSASQRIEKLQSSVYFGRLADQTRKSIMHHLNVLIQQGLLETDVYGRVSISENHEN
ncbi:MAG: RQC domain-containing protein [Candidatus Promineifilaceae bacterium]